MSAAITGAVSISPMRPPPSHISASPTKERREITRKNHYDISRSHSEQELAVLLRARAVTAQLASIVDTHVVYTQGLQDCFSSK